MRGVRTVVITMEEICEEAANVFSYKQLLSQRSLEQGVYYELQIM